MDVGSMNSILLIGLGDIGEHILELLVRVPNVPKIYVAGRNEDACMRKVYSAVSGAVHQGFFPNVEFITLDLNNEEATTETLEKIKPDIIVSSVCIKTWWAPQASLPPEIFRKLDEAGFGPWLPFHFTLVYKLMKAFKKARINACVINCSFPDAVNAILGKLKMAPTVGVGNCDLFIPWMRKIVADKYKVSIKDVSVYLVGHHFLVHALGAYQSTCGCPYYLKIMVNDKDVTDQFDTQQLLIEANKYMPKGQDDHFIVAASTVKNIMCILNDTNELTYAPGPEGLPGGYPIRLSRKGASVYLPEEISKQDAIKINEEAQKFDGIERIEDDGTVVFTKKANEIMKELLGYKCDRLKPDESEERAKELLSTYNNFVAKFTK